MKGPGNKWSDFEGPFDITEAVYHIASLCGQHASPEIINSSVLVHFKNNTLNLVKDNNGRPIDGKCDWNEDILIGEHRISVKGKIYD